MHYLEVFCFSHTHKIIYRFHLTVISCFFSIEFSHKLKNLITLKVLIMENIGGFSDIQGQGTEAVQDRCPDIWR